MTTAAAAAERVIHIKKGLDLPISGRPEQAIDTANEVKNVAVVGFDYIGMKPTMAVNEGDRVERGQLLFTDKKTEGVRFTAPAGGTVVAVNRGEKRVFQSVVIEVDPSADGGGVTFDALGDIASADRQAVRDLMNEAGLWTALRTRPFSKTPTLDATPHSIFVQAIDTNPLAADPRAVIGPREADFRNGLLALTRLADAPVNVCQGPGGSLPGADLPGIRVATFDGPHPAGLPGTHIHFLDPVGANKVVWTINYQDVLALGVLVSEGRLDVERVVSLAGPQVKNPRLVRTRSGACLSELVSGEMAAGDNRVVSGSVLNARATVAGGPFDFLGRFHNQVVILAEGNHREFMGWQKPGMNKFSVKNVYASALARGKRRFAMTTDRNGSRRAMVPVGSYEQVMPLDILPTQMLRALITGDTEEAQQLGALELDEDDVGLLTFVCPGKYEYAQVLRENLTTIEREG